MHFKCILFILYGIPYFFSYKTEFDRSRSLGLFCKGKNHIMAKIHRADLVICSHYKERKPPSYSLLPYKFYVLGQIGLSIQCGPRSDEEAV